MILLLFILPLVAQNPQQELKSLQKLIVQCILIIGIGVITGILAKRKGYNFFCWFLSGSFIGLIALAFLPFANKGDLTQKESDEKKENGNRIGIAISMLTSLIIVLQFIST